MVFFFLLEFITILKLFCFRFQLRIIRDRERERFVGTFGLI